MKTSLLLSLVAAPLLAACAATTKQMSWTDPEKAGQVLKAVFLDDE